MRLAPSARFRNPHLRPQQPCPWRKSSLLTGSGVPGALGVPRSIAPAGTPAPPIRGVESQKLTRRNRNLAPRKSARASSCTRGGRCPPGLPRRLPRLPAVAAAASAAAAAAAAMHRPVVAAGKAWTKRTVVTDPWFKLAKKEGYVSRAAYKLAEIQKKHKIIKPGSNVLDLGCSPGAWMQVACQELGPRDRGGLVLGIDIQPVTVPQKYCDDRVTAMQADARKVSPQMLGQIAPGGFDTVLSDMLHSTSGVNDVDLSIELASTALHIATGYYFDEYGQAYADRVGFTHSGYLRPGGALVMKVYEGSGTNEFMQNVQRYFTKVARMRVEASRSNSREFFAVALGRKKPQPRQE